jgi:hypothetical protein
LLIRWFLLYSNLFVLLSLNNSYFSLFRYAKITTLATAWLFIDELYSFYCAIRGTFLLKDAFTSRSLEKFIILYVCSIRLWVLKAPKLNSKNLEFFSHRWHLGALVKLELTFAFKNFPIHKTNRYICSNPYI